MSRVAAALVLSALACGLAACGGDAGPEVTVIPPDDPRVPTLQRGERACGDMPVRDAGTDYPIRIRATGVDCRTARLIAREVTIDNSSETPLNFTCPDALVDDDLSKHCTKGSLEVTWEVHVQ